MLLASSGSYTIGLLQIPVLSAAVVSAVFHRQQEEHHALGGDVWLIVSAVCFPIAIGFFFAEVHGEAVALLATLAMLAAWMPPRTSDNSVLLKVSDVIASCLPAIAAAVWAAILLSHAIESAYRGY